MLRYWIKYVQSVRLIGRRSTDFGTTVYKAGCFTQRFFAVAPIDHNLKDIFLFLLLMDIF